MEKKLGFVILSYNGDKITENCIDSIIKYYPQALICLVDNDSQKVTIDSLWKKYKSIENVVILKAECNYGYAVGNNIGINYLKEKGIEYIAVVNNDTIFQNSDLYKELIDTEDVGVISLELDNQDGSKQVPYGLINGVYKTYFKLGFLDFLVLTRVYFVLRFIKRALFKKKKQTTTQKVDLSKYEYVISGAGFILTPSFFKYYNQLFNKTFLYCEENILAIYLKKAKLKTKVAYDTKIIHLESQTAQLSSLSIKKIKLGFKSWWKGVRLIGKTQVGITKKYSDKNYKFEILI